jgi:hypothetical protein
MKKGGQKQKSNRHQNMVADFFEKAYYPDGDGEFRSTPGSGGWDKRIAPGDIQPFKFIDKDGSMVFDQSFPFSIECKDWHDDNVKHIFSGLYAKPSQMYDWLEQSIGDAYASGKAPLVVFKLYRTENVVLMHHELFSKLKELFGYFPGETKFKNVYIVKGGPHTIVFVLLRYFIDWIDWGFYKVTHKRKGYISSLVPKD